MRNFIPFTSDEDIVKIGRGLLDGLCQNPNGHTPLTLLLPFGFLRVDPNYNPLAICPVSYVPLIRQRVSQTPTRADTMKPPRRLPFARHALSFWPVRLSLSMSLATR